MRPMTPEPHTHCSTLERPTATRMLHNMCRGEANHTAERHLGQRKLYVSYTHAPGRWGGASMGVGLACGGGFAL